MYGFFSGMIDAVVVIVAVGCINPFGAGACCWFLGVLDDTIVE